MDDLLVWYGTELNSLTGSVSYFTVTGKGKGNFFTPFPEPKTLRKGKVFGLKREKLNFR